MKKILLLSNSTMPGQPFFNWPRPYVKDLLRQCKKAIFIPFAAVKFSFDEYENVVRHAFAEMELDIESVHQHPDPRKCIAGAEAVVIGGGNTFALLYRLYQHDLVGLIRKKVSGGTPYVGWSAGANVACPTIMTTNDMPVIQPPSFEALNLVPFQINPHYTEYRQPGHGGETRMERIEEFLVLNPHRSVIGLPEGMLLHQEDSHLELKGEGKARLFRAGKPVEEISPGEEIKLSMQ